jgi:hypothetical protein
MIMEVDQDIIESCFKNLTHKYNTVRKIFWEKRCSTSFYSRYNIELYGRLIYQPKQLREVCRKYSFDRLINAIDETIKLRRKNYFKSFLKILGEEIVPCGFESYEHKKSQL